jgi:hypothetical protein
MQVQTTNVARHQLSRPMGALCPLCATAPCRPAPTPVVLPRRLLNCMQQFPFLTTLCIDLTLAVYTPTLPATMSNLVETGWTASEGGPHSLGLCRKTTPGSATPPPLVDTSI